MNLFLTKACGTTLLRMTAFTSELRWQVNDLQLNCLGTLFDN